MKCLPRKHLVMLGDLKVHAVREICQGAAEYAHACPVLNFDPWPIPVERRRPDRPMNLAQADLLLLSGDVVELFARSRDTFHGEHVYILTNGQAPDAPCVEFDELAIGRMAAEHLLERQYPNLAFVGSCDHVWSRLRCQGFCEFARARGQSVQIHELPPAQLPIYWSCRVAQRKAGLRHVLAALPKPCGVFVANDVMACFLIETARAGGISVPEQIGVIGVDDDPIPNAAAGLAISTVHTPLREAGWQAARLLDEIRRGRPVPQRTILAPVRVVVRASTNVFMIEDPLVRKAQTYIEAHRQGRLRVSQVGHAVPTTTVTLNKHFMQRLGLSPFEYIQRRRLDYARELLRAGGHTVDEVSDLCGFRNCSYFCRIFKHVIGTTPGVLRRGNVQTRR